MNFTELYKERMRLQKLKLNLAELKNKMGRAVQDEQEAKIFYTELANLAQRAEQTGTAAKLKTILSQELEHAKVIWYLMQDIDKATAGVDQNLRMVEESLRRMQR